MSKRDRALTALGKNVRKRRIALKLSQQRLAAKADLDRSYVSDIERGVRNPSLLILACIAGALRTTLTHLFEGIDR